MATVNFLYRSTKEKANLHLRLLYRFNETDFVFGANTKCEVSKNYWNDEHKKTTFKKPKDVIESNIIQDLKDKQIEVNSELNNIEKHIINAFNSVNPDVINKEWLQTQIDYYYNPPQKAEALPTELLKYYDYFLDCKKNEIAEGTYRKYNVTKHLLQRYELEKKTKLQIIDINDSFKVEFEKYCIKYKYAPNTIAKDLRAIKSVCSHAKYNGLETSYQLEKIKAVYQKGTKIYLSFEDLEAIEKIDPKKLTESLDNTKDWLIISAYTAQRISDFMRFTDKMIRTEDGQSFLEFTQKKTDKLTTIPVHPKVLEILKKRNGMFPYAISDQKYNDYIKTVCEIAELTEMTKGSKMIETAPESGIFRKVTKMYRKCDLVTSHIGRKSFASNFYGTIPTSHLINITNHSSEGQFLAYIGKSNKDLAKETFKYF